MKKEKLNMGWLFWNDLNPDVKIQVDLPHDAMLTEKRLPGIKNGAATGFFPGGKYIYKKELFGEARFVNQVVLLEFEGIYMKSSVFLNGEKIGGRLYGYSNFYVDLSDKIIIGETNEIKVVADNTQTPNSRWYSGSGIYRDVNLLTGHKKHILETGVKVITKSIDPAVIHVSVDISDEVDDSDVLIKVQFDDKLIGLGNGKECDITIPDAALWDADNPNLYKIVVNLLEDDRIIDEKIISTGIRLLEWNSTHGLVINGKEVKLRGGCVHHDNGILGACCFSKAEYRKVKILKEAGFNAVRSAHNPISKAFLDACDHIGIYVMDESFDQWQIKKSDYDYGLYFREEWERDITSMVMKDINHPSVIMYAIGNEIADTGSIEGPIISRQLAHLCKRLDPSRPVTNAINPVVSVMGNKINNTTTSPDDIVDPYHQTQNAQATASLLANIIVTVVPFISKLMGKPVKVEKLLKPCFDEVDVVGYNYAENCYEPHHKWNPKRIMVGSETYPQSIARNWEMVKKHPFIIGDFMWTAWDYLGEAGMGTPIYGKKRGGFNRPYPCISAGCGAIDLTGHMEASAYYAAIVWGEYHKPYIGVRPVNHVGEKYFFGMWRGTDVVNSWSWKGMEGHPAEIEVFSEGEMIELFHDDVCLGRKPLIEYKAKYETIYKPGALKAISYDDTGRQLAVSYLNSASDETHLTVEPETNTMNADGDDLIFVDVSITDNNGITKMLDDRRIWVEVDGAGVLAGIGSGNPYTEDSFLGTSSMTYFGRLIFVIRSNGETGNIKLKITSDGLETQRLTIISRLM
ncbi:MAG: glycoside hydrolase family 2 TIM barrel-domain containing protein [Eubacteriales bacterium]|nr:glycoside hydrolase family 2 TIM barrel-domain containing protein [Eubacteriales bacterium]